MIWLLCCTRQKALHVIKAAEVVQQLIITHWRDAGVHEQFLHRVVLIEFLDQQLRQFDL